MVQGGQPCYTETEWPSTIIDKGKLKYEGPLQATDIETTWISQVGQGAIQVVYNNMFWRKTHEWAQR